MNIRFPKHFKLDLDENVHFLESFGIYPAMFEKKKGAVVTLMAGKVIPKPDSEDFLFKYVKNVGKLAKELEHYKMLKETIRDFCGSHYVSVRDLLERLKMGEIGQSFVCGKFYGGKGVERVL
jgi:hypothetical protein